MAGLKKPGERRFNARLVAPYPARLFGVDAEGRHFRESAQVENISAGGVFIRLQRTVRLTSCVGVAVRLAHSERIGPAVRLAARGIVVRLEPQVDGTNGVAVEFIRRKLY